MKDFATNGQKKNFFLNLKEQLQQSLTEAWFGIQQTDVSKAIEEWRQRFSACVHAKGSHFEHFCCNNGCNMSL